MVEPHNIVRIIAFAPIALLLLCPPAHAAPQLICYNVQPGDTPAALAFRLTSDSQNQHQAWFQIFDPATAQWIPKTGYGRLETGWRACVPAAFFTQPRKATPRIASTATNTTGLGTIIRRVGWWWFPLAMSAMALIFTIVDGFDERRRKISQALESFGKSFVQEFARPESPVQSRLNVLPHKRKLEIFIAPADGRRYPNLSDHRKNLEYDVDRVMTTLADKRFVLGELGAQGPWVVIPFRLDSPSKKAGWS